MGTIDLDTMSMEELKSHRKDVDKAIKNFEERRKKEAAEKVSEIAKEYGVSINDLLATSMKSTRGAYPPKYAHPTQKEITWSGRGRRPAWITEALEAGQSLEDLAI